MKVSYLLLSVYHTFQQIEKSLTVSGILNKTNSVLYRNDDTYDVESVFVGFVGSNMSREGACQLNEGPTNADILAYLEKINNRIGNVEKRLDCTRKESRWV